MENQETNKMSEKTKMEILQGLHEIIWDANRLIEKLAKSYDPEFDFNEFKHDFHGHCNFLSNDTYRLMKIDFE